MSAAVKMITIPYHVYENLLKNCKAKLPSQDSVKAVDDFNMEKLLLSNNRKERKILNEQINKPAKVEIVNLPPPSAPPRILHAGVHKKHIKKSQKNKKLLPKIESSDSDSDDALTINKASDSTATPVISTVPNNQLVVSGTPAVSTTKSNVQATQNSEQDLFTKWYDRIMKNRGQFGVTENGKILNNSSQQIKGSDVTATITWLLNDKKGKAPAGSAKLEERLKTDTVFKNVLNIQSGSGWKPQLW